FEPLVCALLLDPVQEQDENRHDQGANADRYESDLDLGLALEGQVSRKKEQGRCETERTRRRCPLVERASIGHVVEHRRPGFPQNVQSSVSKKTSQGGGF